MKQASKLKAALAAGSLTAAIALLAGMPGAYAQTASGPTAPGGGSMPGSFLVPGTNTSIAFHGLIYFLLDNDFGPHQGDTTAGITGMPLQGPGVANNPEYSVHGGFFLSDKPVRPIIETSTPTAWGELKTYVEFDFNSIGGTQVGAGSADTVRLRQGYGTLGPFLIGQTYSTFSDPQSWGDASGADPTIDAGVPMTTVTGRVPQIRYTWLGGGGLTVAGAIELPTSDWNVASGCAAGPAGTLACAASTAGSSDNALAAGSTLGVQDYPALGLTAQLAQPWGHVALHMYGMENEIRNGVSAVGPGNDIHKFAGAVYLAGHLNTFGKDKFGWGAGYYHGTADLLGDFSSSGGSEQGLILVPSGSTAAALAACSATGALGTNLNGCNVATADEFGLYANYQHWFAPNLRANITSGYEYGFKPDNTENLTGALTTASGVGTTTYLAALERYAYTNHANLIWSPVPGGLDLTLEYQHFYRKMFSGAVGNDNRVVAQAIFTW